MVAVVMGPAFQDGHWPDSEHQIRDLRLRVDQLEAAMARVIGVVNSNARRVQLFSDGLGTSETIKSQSPPDNIIPLRSSGP